MARPGVRYHEDGRRFGDWVVGIVVKLACPLGQVEIR